MPNEAYLVQISPVHWVKIDVLSKEETESSLGVSCQEVDMSEVLIFIAPTPGGVVARYVFVVAETARPVLGFHIKTDETSAPQ